MDTNCCIVGGGPAGMMLGLLLARSGIDTVVLEKHADFFRDFRGDTIHPSTLQIMDDLGILDQFLKLPHDKTTQLHGYVEDEEVTIADFSKLKTRCPYIAFMPQWDFLKFIADRAKQYPNFKLLLQTEATDLIEENGKIVGVVAKSPEGTLQIHSQLVVACDGRHSTIRKCAGLEVIDIAAPMDVMWFKLSRKVTDPNETFGKFSAGRIMIMINRQDYWQCGFVVAKGQAEKLQQASIEAFRERLKGLAPFIVDRVQEIQSWDQVKLLTVKIDRLKQWYLPGLLCIGDAAHAMSPVGGVGINLAVQDAVAAANILIPALKARNVTLKELSAVQKRRTLPMRVIQRMQVLIQNRVIKNVLDQQQALKTPTLIKFFQHVPIFNQITGYLIGMGVRAEHPVNFK